MQNKLIENEKIQNNIYVLWLYNPPVNAISTDFLYQLEYSINKIKNDNKVRCLIIGSKLKHFCAGADLKERSKFTNSQTIDFLDKINAVFNRIENLNIPVICSLNGAVLGGGVELALCCDFRLVGHNLKIGFPETSLGIIPGAGGTYRLSRNIGITNAKKIIFTSQIMNSNEALNINLIDDISSNSFDASIQLAKNIVINAPLAVGAAKSSINNGINKDLISGLSIERNSYLQILGTKDREEALKAFMEKRNPKWENN